MDLAKLAGIADWPMPSMVKQVQFFLGFANFYQWFIDRYSDLTQFLNELMKKDK
jgi:hypothetical protein